MVLYGKRPSPKATRNVIGTPVPKLYGLGWPIGKNSKDPYFTKSSSFNLVRSQIEQLIKTKKGERVMLPDFGVSLHNYLFEPLTSDSVTEIFLDISRAIGKYAPNLNLLAVRVFQDDNIKGFGMPGLKINLSVSFKDDNQSLDFSIVI